MSPEQIEMWREVAVSLDMLSKLANQSGWGALGVDLCLTALDIRCRVDWEERELESNEG